MQLSGGTQSALGITRTQPRRAAAPAYAFFGKKNDEAKRAKQAERDEAWAAQQAVLKRRRDNSWQDGVKSRRADVKRYNTDAEYKKEVDERNRQKFLKEMEDNPPPFGIIIPIAPFGMPAYDGGERFDLRAGHVDNGWVEEGATNSLGDFGKAIGNFFGGKKKKAAEEAEEEAPKGKRAPKKGLRRR